jgi:hypothetical protein
LREGVRAQFAVAVPLAEALADHLAANLWRLKRLPRFERALIAWTRHQQARRHDDGVLRAGPSCVAIDPRALVGVVGERATNRARRQERTLGRTLDVLLAKTDTLGKLCRY